VIGVATRVPQDRSRRQPATSNPCPTAAFTSSTVPRRLAKHGPIRPPPVRVASNTHAENTHAVALIEKEESTLSGFG
jgi:hypothetical protein